MSDKDKAGIYKLTNTINDKVYIGSSSRLRKRKHEHFESLNKNKHRNDYLQNSYNKHGKENFKWEVLEYIDFNQDKVTLKKILHEREQYWIDDYIENSHSLYNIRHTTECSRLGSYQVKTIAGTLSCKDDWEVYYNMYLEGKTFRSLEKLLGICHKTIKKQFIYFGFPVVENGVFTSKGWLNKESIDEWKPYYDMYINENKSLNYLQSYLNLDKTHIKEIFIKLGLEIKSKNQVWLDRNTLNYN